MISFMMTKMGESNEYVEQTIQQMLDEVDNKEEGAEDEDKEDALLVF